MSEKETHQDAERMQRMIDEQKGRNLWSEIFQLRDEQREKAKKTVWLVEGDKLEWENNEQGLMRWYLHPFLDVPCIKSQLLYVQKIPAGGRSGRIHHPGGQVVFAWEGSGYTVIDGQKYHWQKNDVVQFPMKLKGVTVQHFNTDPDNDAMLICCEANYFQMAGVDRGSVFEQLEVSPDYKKKS
jgi:gentisate 1,2-dioxygenase